MPLPLLNRMPVPPPGRVAIALDPMLPVIVTGPPGVSVVEPSAGIPPDGGAIVVAYDGTAAWAVPAPTAIIVAVVAAISTFVIAIFHCFGIPGVIPRISSCQMGRCGHEANFVSA